MNDFPFNKAGGPFGFRREHGDLGFRKEFGELGVIAGDGLQVVGLGPAGRVLIGARRARRAASAVPTPFTIVDAGNNRVTVVPGTVASASGGTLVPTIGGIGIDTLPAPELAITGAGFVALRVSVGATGEASFAQIAFVATMPANTPSLAHLALAQIANFNADGFVILQLVGGSQAYQKCGAAHLWGRV